MLLKFILNLQLFIISLPLAHAIRFLAKPVFLCISAVCEASSKVCDDRIKLSCRLVCLCKKTFWKKCCGQLQNLLLFQKQFPSKQASWCCLLLVPNSALFVFDDNFSHGIFLQVSQPITTILHVKAAIETRNYYVTTVTTFTTFLAMQLLICLFGVQFYFFSCEWNLFHVNGDFYCGHLILIQLKIL